MQKMEIEIEAPANAVWDALISREALRDWFNVTIEIEPRVGGGVRFEGTSGDRPFRFNGSVDALTPSERIAFELRSESGGTALMSFSLRPADDHTSVVLQHEGFDEAIGDGVSFWDGDELIALREYVTGIGPTH
jgi:uncharacterized protein YndB with AHSA1/START domain